MARINPMLGALAPPPASPGVEPYGPWNVSVNEGSGLPCPPGERTVDLGTDDAGHSLGVRGLPENDPIGLGADVDQPPLHVLGVEDEH